MISSGLSAVESGPRKKSAAAMLRGPALPSAVISASQVTAIARQFGGGVGVGEAAADRAAIADLIMRHVLDGGHQQRMRVAQARVGKNIAPAHHGAERNAGLGNPDLREFIQLAEIDKRASARRRGTPASAPGSGRRRAALPRRHARREARPLRQGSPDGRSRRAGNFMAGHVPSPTVPTSNRGRK